MATSPHALQGADRRRARLDFRLVPGWFWGPIALALLIAGLTFLITLAVGKTEIRDPTAADVDVLNVAFDSADQQPAAMAATVRAATMARDLG